MMLDQQDIAEATDYEPARVVRVKKMTWSDQDRAFCTQYFLRIRHETTAECLETVAWCLEQFGRPCYQRTWWQCPVTPQIWLADNLATFWQLRWGHTA